jgi:hypothetical protein
MKSRSLNPFVIITLLAITILTVNGYQMKVAFSQDEETPDFGGTKAPFTPLPEDDRNPPPPPSNATKVNELPKSLFVEENDTDSEPLVIANKTELLEVLPANATNAIEFIDSSLKNSTGQGLLPAGVLNNVTGAGNLNMSSEPTGEKRNITTILDFLNKENLTKEILPLISPANKSVTSEDLEEMDEPQPSNVTENATTSEEQPASENATTSEEQPASENATTSEEQPASENATTSEEQSGKDEAVPPINQESDQQPPGKDEAVPPINQESDQQPPVAEDEVNTKIKEPLNNTELALSNNTEQEPLNNTDLGPSKDSKE